MADSWVKGFQVCTMRICRRVKLYSLYSPCPLCSYAVYSIRV